MTDRARGRLRGRIAQPRLVSAPCLGTRFSPASRAAVPDHAVRADGSSRLIPEARRDVVRGGWAAQRGRSPTGIDGDGQPVLRSRDRRPTSRAACVTQSSSLTQARFGASCARLRITVSSSVVMASGVAAVSSMCAIARDHSAGWNRPVPSAHALPPRPAAVPTCRLGTPLPRRLLSCAGTCRTSTARRWRSARPVTRRGAPHRSTPGRGGHGLEMRCDRSSRPPSSAWTGWNGRTWSECTGPPARCGHHPPGAARPDRPRPVAGGGPHRTASRGAGAPAPWRWRHRRPGSGQSRALDAVRHAPQHPARSCRRPRSMAGPAGRPCGRGSSGGGGPMARRPA